MRKLYVVGLGTSILLSSSAFAADANVSSVAPEQLLKLRIRTDFFSGSTESTVLDKTTTKSSGFRIPKMDATFINKLGSHGTLDVRLSFIQSGGTYGPQSTSAAAPISNLIEHAWADFNLGPVVFRAGKLDSLAGNIEYLKVSSMDFYINSYYFSTFIPPRPVGVSTFLNVAGQKIELQVANGIPGKDATGATSYETDGGLNVALGYHGDFGAVKPLVTISQINYAQTKPDAAQGARELHKSPAKIMIGVGAVATFAGATIEGEVNSATVNKWELLNADSTKTEKGKKETATGVIFTAKYAIGPVTPILKMTSDTHKKGIDENVGDISQTGISLAAEYAVAKDARFHLAFNKIDRTTTKASGGTDKKDATSEIIWGTALKI